MSPLLCSQNRQMLGKCPSESLSDSASPRPVTLARNQIPYMVLTEKAVRGAPPEFDFDRERQTVAGYWRRRLDESAKLITPEGCIGANRTKRNYVKYVIERLIPKPQFYSRRSNSGQ